MLASGTFGNGTVEAYALFTNANGTLVGGAVTPLNRYAAKNGALISTPTLTNTSTTGDTFGNANVFTTNDPAIESDSSRNHRGSWLEGWHHQSCIASPTQPSNHA